MCTAWDFRGEVPVSTGEASASMGAPFEFMRGTVAPQVRFTSGTEGHGAGRTGGAAETDRDAG